MTNKVKEQMPLVDAECDDLYQQLVEFMEKHSKIKIDKDIPSSKEE